MKRLSYGWLCLGISQALLGANLKPCSLTSHCNDGEVCVSYTACNGQQIRRCLPRTCYRSGAGCPSDIVCHKQHCASLGCPK